MIDDVEVNVAGVKGQGVVARHAFSEGEFIFRRRHTLVVAEDELAGLSDWEQMHL